MPAAATTPGASPPTPIGVVAMTNLHNRVIAGVSEPAAQLAVIPGSQTVIELPTVPARRTATDPERHNPASVRDRLVDELLHLLAEVGALRARRLRHQHCGDLLLRVDPEIGAAVARPHVLARRTRNRGNAVGKAHREAEPESVALAAEEQHARVHRQVHRAAEMVR